jgi:hypothetical protein
MFTIAGGILIAALILSLLYYSLDILEFITTSIYEYYPWIIFIAIWLFVVEVIF